MKRVNILFGLIGIALGLYVFAVTATFPDDAIMKIGPGFFPRILAVALVLFCLVLIIQNLAGKGEKGESGFDIKDPGVHRSALVLLITVLYAVIIPFAGFVAASVIYLFILMYLMKLRKWIQMIAVSTGVSFAIYFIFSVLLKIALPQGFLS
ncbi:MAG: tripartite tricarboxylate transporter TctB family protein [Spirochaetales bacterium]|nr:tripartite tricarboxylate transporter TctB family protein [Spirochaetales bacterium]